jgi:hypothetical protein
MDYLNVAADNHFKLLIVPEECQERDQILRTLQANGWRRFDVTKEVLKIAANIPKEKRLIRLSLELKAWLNNLQGDKFLFANIGILFSPELGKIDPIRLFKYFSRGRQSVLLFPGRISGQKAEFSQEGKPDYMTMDVSEVVCYPTR